MASRIIDIGNLQTFTAVNLLSDGGAISGFKQLPSCAQIRLHWTQEDGKTAFNVLVGRYSGVFAGTPAQADAILTALGTGGAFTALAAFFATTSALAAVSIRDMNTPGNPYIQSTGATHPGTSVSPALPNEVALVCTLRTAHTGPGNRGRVYVPGWATNALGAGNVAAAAAVTALNSWFGTFSGALSGSGYTWSLGQPARQAYTGTTGTLHPARAAGSSPITFTTVRDNHWDSQRRRGLK